jgi:predicted dehydrogenase
MGHRNCRIVAVCDVNANRLEEARKIVNEHYGSTDCATYTDYREVLARAEIDAVSIATPDQWHVLQAVEAARAGKDIFLEKPLGLSVKDDLALRDAVRDYERVFQFGTQQRSDWNFGFACELVHNGRIGKLQRIVVSVPASRAVGRMPPAPVPPWLDWERWVGPARWRPFTQGIVGNCGEWGHMSNFSLGWITTWGIHHVDIAQWGNAADQTGPVEVEGAGVFPAEGLYDCATAWDMTWKYANGVVVRFLDKGKRRQGVLFEGSDGSVFVERGVLEAEPKSLLQERIGPEERHLSQGTDHWGGFLECVKTRKTPVSSIESAVRTDTICHLCDIAMRLGRSRAGPGRRAVRRRRGRPNADRLGAVRGISAAGRIARRSCGGLIHCGGLRALRWATGQWRVSGAGGDTRAWPARPDGCASRSSSVPPRPLLREAWRRRRGESLQRVRPSRCPRA